MSLAINTRISLHNDRDRQEEGNKLQTSTWHNFGNRTHTPLTHTLVFLPGVRVVGAVVHQRAHRQHSRLKRVPNLAIPRLWIHVRPIDINPIAHTGSRLNECTRHITKQLRTNRSSRSTGRTNTQQLHSQHRHIWPK